MISDADLEKYHRDGYLRIPKIFSAEEIGEFRRKVEEIRRRAHAEKWVRSEPKYPKAVFILGDVLGMHELKDRQYAIFDDRVVSIAKKVLGEKVVYFGDSSIQTGEGFRGYHKDNVDRDDPKGPDWNGDYTMAQFGIYLQDHSRHGGGLKLRVGSHRILSRRKGKPVNIPSETGDVLVWNSRITHSGNAVRLKAMPLAVLPPLFEKLTPRFLRVPDEQERMVIFGTFGAPGPHVDRYIEFEAKREDCRDYWKRSCVNPEIRSLAESQGIELRQPIPEYGSLHPLHQSS